MVSQLSPGIEFREIDLTTSVPAVATTEGAIAGVFRWGPTEERILISSENSLVSRFGEPYANSSWHNHETWFSASNFLSYSDSLYVVRVDNGAATAANTHFQALYHGELGNSLMVSFCDEDSFEETEATANIMITAASNTAIIEANDTEIEAGDSIIIQGQELSVSKATINDANTNIEFNTKYIATDDYNSADWSYQWGYASLFDDKPGTDEIHVVVVDQAGMFTGIKNSVLEVYDALSTEINVRNLDGSTNYWKAVLEQRSNYIKALETAVTPSDNGYQSLTSGSDGMDESTVPVGNIGKGYNLFRSNDDVDISLIITGHARGTVLSNYIIDNVAEFRKDTVVFVSPMLANTASYSAQDLIDGIESMSNSSYVVVDSGYKQQYDRYADIYRWIPLNGDIAGLCARTDNLRDPWFSPAGINRGGIKNIVKLGLNPDRSSMDLLYKNNINPVITQPGQGTYLNGDKTYSNRHSAFDRINVRRLFIVLEKAIARASKSMLFEFNDEFTRAQFRNLVEPFLRDVQGRRGIFDFRVVCDNTNNTPEVIDSSRFVGDIYIKPARSINFILLNFVAVRTGVEFNEIVGNF